MLAMSSYYYTWSFFQLTTGMEQKSSDLTALAAAAQQFCTLNAADQREYNSKLKHPAAGEYLYNFCFAAGFAHALLHTGYGLPLSGTPIYVINTIQVRAVLLLLLALLLMTMMVTMTNDDEDNNTNNDTTYCYC